MGFMGLDFLKDSKRADLEDEEELSESARSLEERLTRGI